MTHFPVLSATCAILCPLNSIFSCRPYPPLRLSGVHGALLYFIVLPLMQVKRQQLVLREIGMFDPDEWNRVLRRERACPATKGKASRKRFFNTGVDISYSPRYPFLPAGGCLAPRHGQAVTLHKAQISDFRI
jgi:hypothetical protein